MMTLKYPEADVERAILLDTLVSAGEEELAAGNEHLPRHFLDEIATLGMAFRTAFTEVDRLVDDRVGAVDKRKEAVKTLKQFVRAFRSTVLWRVKLYDWSERYVSYFHLPKRMPGHFKDTRLVQIADTYLRGELLALSEGYPPMASPSANELRAKRHQAAEQIARTKTVMMRLDMAQHRLVAIRQQVDALFRHVSRRLDYALYQLPADDIRQIKRRYGFQYYDRHNPNHSNLDGA